MTRFIDISGKRFGKLTVLGVSQNRKRGVLSWDCICDCGNRTTVAGPDLRVGDTHSCGCEQHKGTPKDISGVKRGSLTAVSSTGQISSNGDYMWNFICDCGGSRVMTLGSFNSKRTLACKECNKKSSIERTTTHGFSRSHKTYTTWARIKNRCCNPKSQDWADYGGKGITIHESFKDDFLCFYREVGDAPKQGKWSIDRIDCTKGYEPGNLRWATDDLQSRNKSKFKNNTTGVTGVQLDNKPWPDGSKKLYAKAVWNEVIQGKHKQCSKSFSVEKYGLLEAFAMACKYRENKICELNALGYGYTPNHGK